MGALGEVEPNYFTCTLGQAAQRRAVSKDAQSFDTVVGLIDEQARRAPEALALGFASVKGDSHTSTPSSAATFGQLRDWSVVASQTLSSQLESFDDEDQSGKRGSASTAVGLLCTSSMDFALTWLALMRLGYSVLILAYAVVPTRPLFVLIRADDLTELRRPQLESKAIQHLCATTGAKAIVVDDSHRESVSRLTGGIRILSVVSPSDAEARPSGLEKQLVDGSDTAFFMHTSGTTTGLPKAIAQSHWGVVGCLPSFPCGHGQHVATFTTTPLYHGGIADCLRAWTSRAMIWAFPEGLAPITGGNVLKAVRSARGASRVPVGYFSSVPYVLQMLAEEDGGVQLLRSMDLVGVGGAALPTAVGDRLVEAGVKLLSRMGSTECGFLMSSHRDYAADKEWQYLRPVRDPDMLAFEGREKGLSELVARPGWPYRARPNRHDGSYGTCDLFEPHQAMADAWRYHSRADAQITLANGKKFDPSAMEDSLLANKALRDVLLFGTGRHYAGALLFPSSHNLSPRNVIDSVWMTMEEINKASPSHARITPSMMVVVPAQQGQTPLDRSSKGTILRRQAEERYADLIESAYSGSSSPSKAPVSDEQLPSTVLDCFSQVLARPLDPDRDLFRQGVDSLACIQIRKRVEATCLPPGGVRLPMNVIYDQATITALIAYLRRLRGGRVLDEDDDDDAAQWAEMLQLADRYSVFLPRQAPFPPPSPSRPKGRVVVLTGATGFLGVHMLHLLRQDVGVERIYCLVRAPTPTAARARVSDALSSRALGELGSDVVGKRIPEVVCIPCHLPSADLGMSTEQRELIRSEATVLIHAAWTVNFTLRLGSFEDQIAGTRNLLDLSCESGARCVFISSVAAVTGSRSNTVAEAVSEDAADASPLGYSRSKWVAERVCAAANDGRGRAQEPTVTIIRVGQLCGSEAGLWNASEAYPLLLSTAAVTGCLPDLPRQALDWLPVDQAAAAVLELSFADGAAVQTDDAAASDARTATPVYHVLNRHSSPTWKQMLVWMSDQTDSSSPCFDIVPPSEWVRRLAMAVKAEAARHPAQALLGMWAATHCDGNAGPDKEPVSAPRGPTLETARSEKLSATLCQVEPLDRARVMRMWDWVRESIPAAH